MDYLNTTSNGHLVTGRSNLTVCDLLNRQVIDTLQLQLEAETASVAVSAGSDTAGLSYLFAGVATDLIHSIRFMVARINALGGQVRGSMRMVAQQSSRKQCRGMNMRRYLEALLSAYLEYELSSLSIIKAVEELRDPETEFLLKTIACSIERNLWLLERHLDAVAAGSKGKKLPEWTPAFENNCLNIDRNRACSHGLLSF